MLKNYLFQEFSNVQVLEKIMEPELSFWEKQLKWQEQHKQRYGAKG